MKKINCAIIQDLLPSYCDKISSNETTLLVEEHLRNCSNCKQTLEKLNKDLHIESVNNRQEEIDYLKGYRRNKKMSIIFAIALSLIVIDVLFLIFGYVLPIICWGIEYPVNINDINVEYMYTMKSDYNNSTSLAIFLYSDKYKQLNSYKQHTIFNSATGEYEVYFKIVGKNFFQKIDTPYISGCEEYIGLDKIGKIYIVDDAKRSKEIWNKNTKVFSSREEWAKWYIDSYVPEEAKYKFNINYDNLLYGACYATGMWRHLYKMNLN